MKKMRRFAAIAAAAAMTACMAVPMMAVLPASAATIKISGITAEAHTFEVYQVFTGTLSGTKLSDLKWGSGVTAYEGTAVTEGAAVSDTISSAMTADGVTADDILADLTLGTAAKTVSSTSDTLTIDGLADGYYVVKDVTNLDNKDDANSAWIVQVAGSAELAIKNASPKVDKQVLDETADAESGHSEGWGESADHAINETFQFKLIATVPKDPDLKEYDTYQLVFNDTMSSGVTFESIESVTVAGKDVAYTLSDNAVDGAAGITWDLTIADVKKPAVDAGEVWGDEEITVEVIYNAHLNENAHVATEKVENGTTDNVNNNMVYLQYSNNPDSTGTGTSGLGETTKDYVWVFTYTVENTKVSNTENGPVLGGAKFELLNGTTKIKLIDNKNGTYTVADQDATEGVVTEMVSNDLGKFDIIGLDAGTYTLHETAAPGGYNTCEDVTVKIGAAHAEDTDGNVDLTLTNDSTMANKIVNKEGSTLPSTGGIGTTIFYVVGGTLVAGAGVALIAKKRMKNNQE